MANISLHTYYQDLERILRQGEYYKVIQHGEYIFERMPGQIRTYVLLARAYRAVGKQRRGIEVFSSKLKVMRRNAQLRVYLARMFAEVGEVDQALFHLLTAFSVDGRSDLYPDIVKLLRKHKAPPAALIRSMWARLTLARRRSLCDEFIESSRFIFSISFSNCFSFSNIFSPITHSQTHSHRPCHLAPELQFGGSTHSNPHYLRQLYLSIFQLPVKGEP